ncbi:MAG: tRNA pseudouridine(38-40) synthase TruA [Deltaproteobacteria bacterium]|nr:tRNA pseudouridine(38-40) synthase TruA [Deltaproteobacteria bacterium]
MNKRGSLGIPFFCAMNERNIKLILTYDGTHYHGWQRQKNAVTLQQTVEDRLAVMLGHPVTLIASGRTDAGVHALAQVCHFMTRSRIPAGALKKGLNSLLRDDILIKDVQDVPLDFHARYHVKRKTYEYRILNQPQPDLFRRRFCWHIPVPLNVDAMAQCLSLLEGTHDFSSFRSSGSGNQNPVRTLYAAQVNGASGEDLTIILEADGFLRHMVRNMVGTVVQAGLNRLDVDGFEGIVAAKDRRMAGVKAPARGLFLIRVRY